MLSGFQNLFSLNANTTNNNYSSIIIIITVITLMTLLLVYMILNVNSKLNNFMDIYNDEQNKQYDELNKSFSDINKSNKNIKNLINSKKEFLDKNELDLSNLNDLANENKKIIDDNNNKINNLKDVSYNTNNKAINLGSNNKLSIQEDGLIKFNVKDSSSLKLCDKNGNNCSVIMNEDLISKKLPVLAI